MNDGQKQPCARRCLAEADSSHVSMPPCGGGAGPGWEGGREAGEPQAEHRCARRRAKAQVLTARPSGNEWPGVPAAAQLLPPSQLPSQGGVSAVQPSRQEGVQRLMGDGIGTAGPRGTPGSVPPPLQLYRPLVLRPGVWPPHFCSQLRSQAGVERLARLQRVGGSVCACRGLTPNASCLQQLGAQEWRLPGAFGFLAEACWPVRSRSPLHRCRHACYSKPFRAWQTTLSIIFYFS